MSGHTKDPWQFERIPAIFNPKMDGFQIIAATPAGNDVMTVALCTVGDHDEANARRIVACVNACAELPQDALDGGWTALGMSRHARNVEEQRDELLAIVKGFHRKLETYRNIYTGDTELHRLLSECEAAITKAQ